MPQTLGHPAGLCLNEWMALGSSPVAGDYLELFNPNPLPVALGGCYLSDKSIGAPAGHQIAPLSFLAGDGHAVFWPTAIPVQAPGI